MDKKDGFLTPQELEYWSERFCVNDMDIPTLPQTEYLSLSKNVQLLCISYTLLMT